MPSPQLCQIDILRHLLHMYNPNDYNLPLTVQEIITR